MHEKICSNVGYNIYVCRKVPELLRAFGKMLAKANILSKCFLRAFGKIFYPKDQLKLNEYAIKHDIAVLNGWDGSIDMVPGKSGITQEVGEFSKIIAEYKPTLPTIIDKETEENTKLTPQQELEKIEKEKFIL